MFIHYVSSSSLHNYIYNLQTHLLWAKNTICTLHALANPDVTTSQFDCPLLLFLILYLLSYHTMDNSQSTLTSDDSVSQVYTDDIIQNSADEDQSSNSSALPAEKLPPLPLTCLKPLHPTFIKVLGDDATLEKAKRLVQKVYTCFIYT